MPIGIFANLFSIGIEHLIKKISNFENHFKHAIMKTIIVNIPEKKEDFFLSLLKEFHFKSKVLTKEEKEDMSIAKWINEGLKSKDVAEEVVFNTLRKHGVKI